MIEKKKQLIIIARGFNRGISFFIKIIVLVTKILFSYSLIRFFGSASIKTGVSDYYKTVSTVQNYKICLEIGSLSKELKLNPKNIAKLEANYLLLMKKDDLYCGKYRTSSIFSFGKR